MTSSHSYRRLIIDREIGPLLFAANFGRLSGGIVPFGLVAFYSDRQEYIHAGVASAVLMVVSCPNTFNHPLVTAGKLFRTIGSIC